MTTPLTCSCARFDVSRARSRSTSCASPCSTMAASLRSGRSLRAVVRALTRAAAGQVLRLRTDMALGIEGESSPGPARAAGGRRGVLRLVVGGGLGGARRREGCERADRRHQSVLAQLAVAGAHPRPRVGPPDPALRARDQGNDLHADGRDDRRVDDLAARNPGRRAQLGLSIHLDAGRHVHAAGAALPQPRLGGGRVHAVRRRPRAEQRRCAADHVRHRRPA